MEQKLNSLFREFRNAFIREIHSLVSERGGRIEFVNKTVEIRFTGLDYYEEAFGTVSALALTVSPEFPGAVFFSYRMPCLSEENSYYVDEDSSEEIFEVMLDEFSMDEIDNIINAID